MPRPKPGPNRHHYRVWIKWVLESGLIDRLPPRYDFAESESPRDTAQVRPPFDGRAT